MNSSLVCVDANLLIKLVVPEPYSERAADAWESWAREGIIRIAPRLLRYEVTSTLRKQVWRGLLTSDMAEAALEQLLSLRIELLDPDDLQKRAWKLAARFGMPAAYDGHYLALAELVDCQFWTGDERLFNSTAGFDGRVRWIGRVA
jgi:predicted nucleic acid-binding protein